MNRLATGLSVKPFEWSDELYIALYKTIPFYVDLFYTHTHGGRGGLVG